MLTKMPQKSESNTERKGKETLLNSEADIKLKEDEMRLQKASGKDLEDIAKIYKEEFSKPPYNEKWTSSLAIKKIKDYSTFCDIWKLNYNNEIAGFIIINTRGSIGLPKEVCFGEEIAVKSEYQGKGLGAFILEETFKKYKERGFKTFLGIANRNGPLKLYKRLNLIPSKENILVERRLK